MYLSTSLLFAFHALLPLTSAGKLSCSQACQQALGYLIFNGTDPTADYYEAQCSNEVQVQSIYLCIRHYCTPRGTSPLIEFEYGSTPSTRPSHTILLIFADALSEIRAGFVEFNATFQEYGKVFLPPYSIIANISEKDAEQLPKADAASCTNTEELNTAVFLSEGLYDLARRTINTWNDSEVTRATYGYAMYGILGGRTHYRGRLSRRCVLYCFS